MTVVWTHPAERDLKALDTTQAARVVEAVERFASTGHGNVKALKGSTAKRLRMGAYRVRFESDGAIMTILHVDHRKEAYRR